MATILGIDPGSRVTGYGVIRVDGKKISYVSSGCIRLSQNSLMERLYSIYKDVAKVMEVYQVNEVAIEQVFMHRNPGSALKLGHARGAAIVGASTATEGIFEYSAKRIKLAVTGYGGASKIQVQKMVLYLLNLQGPVPSDSSDALAAAMCHAYARQGVQKEGLPRGRAK